MQLDLCSFKPKQQYDLDTGDEQTITWDVASTDAAPVNCLKVNILFSAIGDLQIRLY
jgi:hypothetical protein